MAKRSKSKKVSNIASIDFKEHELFRNMINRIGDEIFVIDSNGVVQFVNNESAKGLGYAKNYILGKKFNYFFKKKINIKDWQRKDLKKLRESKKPISYKIERVCKGGAIQTMDIKAVYMEYKEKEYVLAVCRDITSQIVLQNKLRESEDRFRLISEQAADGIFTVDLEGYVVYSNLAAENIVKANPGKTLGTHFTNYVDKDSMMKAKKTFIEVKKGKPMLQELDVIDLKGNIVPVQLSVSPNYKSNKLFQIIVIMRDISKKKQYDDLVRETEKMQALQQFISGTTYEIQYPLKGLQDRCQLLIDEYKNRAFEYIGYKEFKNIIKTLENMRDQAKYCFDTTQRLLSINRKKVGLKTKYCKVNETIFEIVDVIKLSMEMSDIKIKLNFAEKLPFVAVGSIEFNQIIINIINNAVQSMLNKGEMFISTSYQKESNAIKIECRDTGIGIPKEALPHIFEPFFTTKRRGVEKNSGLGLSIVYSIIKAHKGDISIKSNLRKGTSVKIILPAYKKK